MKEVWKRMSQNGRRGIALVGPETTAASSGGPLRLIGEGSILPVGIIAGTKTFSFSPGETGTWIAVTGDCHVHGGASVAATEDLQGGEIASILLLSPEAVVEHYGYKRRASRILAYVRGQEKDIPSTVLAAMGLVAAEAPLEEVPHPPALDGAMASAFSMLARK